MRPVDGSPFPVDSFDFKFPDFHVLAIAKQYAEMVLGLSVLDRKSVV